MGGYLKSIFLFLSLTAVLCQTQWISNTLATGKFAYHLGLAVHNYPDQIECVRKSLVQSAECFKGETSRTLKEIALVSPSDEIDKNVYDLVINASSLRSIGTSGWQLVFHKDRNEEEIRKALTGKFKIVCALGDYNTGKTWVLAKLTGKELPFGFDWPTRGLSLLIHKTQGNDPILYLDTEGSKRATLEADLPDRVATDQFLVETAVQQSDVILYFLGPLHHPLQVSIQSLIDLVVANSSPQAPKTLVFVHNFREFTTESEVSLHVKTDIIEAFGATPRESDSRTYYEHIDGTHQITFNHVILALEGSVQGEKWNTNTRSLIKEWIRGAREAVAQRDFFNVTKKIIEDLLPEYFHEGKEEYCPMKPPGKTEVTNFGGKVFQAFRDLGDALTNFFSKGNQPETPRLGFEVITSPNKTLVLKEARELNYLQNKKKGISGRYTPQKETGFNNTNWIIRFDVPGFNKEDLKVHVHRRKVAVSGFRCADRLGRLDTDKNVNERKFGEFRNVFILPDAAEEKPMGQVLEGGVFTISFPLSEDTKVTHEEL